MEPSRFDEVAFFSALHRSGARALLIGRKALVLLGLPVLTADYDFWVSIEDIGLFNAVGLEFDLHPSRSADEARKHGRYTLENDEHVDVLVARSIATVGGSTIEFDTLCSRRQSIPIEGVTVAIPSIDDLILTKQVAASQGPRRHSAASHPQRSTPVIDDRIAAAIDRAVTPEEIQHAFAREIPASEREDVEDLIRWFTTRYPTPEARLQYVRQALARWCRSTKSG